MSEQTIVDERAPSRRHALGMVGAAAATVTLLLADGVRRAPRAEAAPYCCSLVYPNSPCGNPSGCTWRYWLCYSSQMGMTLACAECVTSGSTCWTSDVKSSCWWPYN